MIILLLERLEESLKRFLPFKCRKKNNGSEAELKFKRFYVRLVLNRNNSELDIYFLKKDVFSSDIVRLRTVLNLVEGNNNPVMLILSETNLDFISDYLISAIRAWDLYLNKKKNAWKEVLDLEDQLIEAARIEYEIEPFKAKANQAFKNEEYELALAYYSKIQDHLSNSEKEKMKKSEKELVKFTSIEEEK